MELFYTLGSTPAAKYATQFLEDAGVQTVDHPTPEITHLLLDVPSFGPDGVLRGGGQLSKILEMLPQYITVVGGNLDHPVLEGYKALDLLQDPMYLAKNAAITADCALQVAAPLLTTVFSQTPVLIIGWGRIGKCLAKKLRDLGSPVTVAARKASDRALLEALGYIAEDPGKITNPEQYRLVFNTAPEPVFSKTPAWKNCIQIDLASKKGLDGENVIRARGLPGIYAPESSGKLIADTILRNRKEAVL